MSSSMASSFQPLRELLNTIVHKFEGGPVGLPADAERQLPPSAVAGEGHLPAPAVAQVRLPVHLVEISPALRARQEQTLRSEHAIQWHDTIESVPDGPALVIANEFVTEFLGPERAEKVLAVTPINRANLRPETGSADRMPQLSVSASLGDGRHRL